MSMLQVARIIIQLMKTKVHATSLTRKSYGKYVMREYEAARIQLNIFI